jgi:hypothetical protein
MPAFLLPALVAALILLAIAAPASAQPVGAAPYVVLVFGSSVDLGATLHGIQSGRAREGNPLRSHGGTPGLVAGKVAGTALLGWGMMRIARHGHPRLAKFVGYAAGIALTGLGARNTQVGR